jgi:hypothetical protein
MAHDTVPMYEMRAACMSVLQQHLVPLRYTAVTDLALTKLGYPPKARDEINWMRQIEDVREKLGKYDNGGNGFLYTGTPDCLLALRDWYVKRPFLDAFEEQVEIPINAEMMVEGIFEATMRIGWMVDKFGKAPETRNMAIAEGYAKEFPMRHFFKTHWPEFYREPENNGQWDRPCDHDFRLLVGARAYRVDVMGPRQRDKSFGLNPGKHPTDMHLLCERDGDTVLWIGTVRGEKLSERIIPEEVAISPVKLIVWLNSLKHQIKWQWRNFECLAKGIPDTDSQNMQNVRKAFVVQNLDAQPVAL